MTIFDGYIANLKNILKALWLVIMNIVINLSIPISLPNASRFFKIIMLIFPQINQLFNTQILIHFQLYINYDFNCIFFDYNGVTFFETLLFYLIDLFLYIFGSFFILNYRESGLPLLQYIFSSFVLIVLINFFSFDLFKYVYFCFKDFVNIFS